MSQIIAEADLLVASQQPDFDAEMAALSAELGIGEHDPRAAEVVDRLLELLVSKRARLTQVRNLKDEGERLRVMLLQGGSTLDQRGRSICAEALQFWIKNRSEEHDKQQLILDTVRAALEQSLDADRVLKFLTAHGVEIMKKEGDNQDGNSSK